MEINRFLLLLIPGWQTLKRVMEIVYFFPLYLTILTAHNDGAFIRTVLNPLCNSKPQTLLHSLA